MTYEKTKNNPCNLPGLVIASNHARKHPNTDKRAKRPKTAKQNAPPPARNRFSASRLRSPLPIPGESLGFSGNREAWNPLAYCGNSGASRRNFARVRNDFRANTRLRACGKWGEPIPPEHSCRVSLSPNGQSGAGCQVSHGSKPRLETSLQSPPLQVLLASDRIGKQSNRNPPQGGFFMYPPP
jgi:hypothetical protein